MVLDSHHVINKHESEKPDPIKTANLQTLRDSGPRFFCYLFFFMNEFLLSPRVFNYVYLGRRVKFCRNFGDSTQSSLPEINRVSRTECCAAFSHVNKAARQS